jgi:5-methylcytosine-specific restriction endonuclease McrBC regulatory subunit McrC
MTSRAVLFPARRAVIACGLSYPRYYAVGWTLPVWPIACPAPLQPDNVLSQLILALIHRLVSITRSARTSTTLQHCARLLDRVTLVPLTPGLVSRVQLTRFESEWQPVLDFARILLQGQSPNPVTGGSQSAFTLLFSLHDVFEALLRRLLPRALEDTPLQLAPRRNLNLLYSPSRDIEVLQLRPDYLFTTLGVSAKSQVVGDAKWKRLKYDRTTFDLSPSDIYQLTTYMARHHLQRGVLFFPMTPWMRREKGSRRCWVHRFNLQDGPGIIHIVGVDVAALASRGTTQQEALTGLKEAVLESWNPP